MENVIRAILENRKSILIVYLVLFAGGVLGYRHLRYALLPEVENRFLVITMPADEMPPEMVEYKLLGPIRQAVSGIPGVKDVYSSQSRNGAAIHIEVDHGAHAGDIQYLSQNALNQIISTIPEYKQKLLVERSADHQLPLITLHVTGKSLETTSRVSESFIKARLEQIHGVGFIEFSGIQKERFIIIPDLNKISRLGLRLHEFVELLHSNETHAVEMKNSGSFIVSSNSHLDDISKKRVKGMIRVGDLCRIEKHKYFPRGKTYLGSEPSVSLDIYARPGYSIQETSDEIEKYISRFNQQERDIQVKITSNRSSVIEQTTSLLIKAVIVAITGCILVVFVITGDLVRTLFVSLSIPLTLFPVIAVYVLFQIEIHIFILGGAVLGMGLIIDNAIIVIDELSGSCQNNEISIAGSLKSIMMPLILATITTIISFVPVLFLHPISYLLFHEQALALFALLISSLFIALVILPNIFLVVSRRSKRNSHSGLFRGIPHSAIFRLITDRPVLIGWVHASIIILAALFFLKIDVKVIPSLSYQEWEYQIPDFITERSFREMLSLAVFEVDPGSIVTGNYNHGHNKYQPSIIKVRYPLYRDLADSSLFQNRFIYQPSANPITWLFPYSLQTYSFRAYRRADIPYEAQLNITGSKMDTIIRLSPKWELAGVLGESLSSLLAKEAPVQITENLLLKNADSDLRLHSGKQAVSIERISTVLPEIHSQQRYRDQRGEFFLLQGNLKRDSVNRHLHENGFFVFDPEERMRSDFRYAGIMAICGATAIIYFLLLFQYRSFIWPLLVMVSLPVSMSGSIIALYLTGEGLNMISSVGMVVGLGISVNDAILKADTFRKFLQQDLTVSESIRLTSLRRIRPILITSCTTVFACLPMYFFKGTGNEIQGSMGIAILGGVVTSTFAAIFLIPVLLKFVQRLANHTANGPGVGVRRRLVGE